jgi:hypothetical protein
MNNTLVKIESPQISTDLASTGWSLPTTMTESDWKQAGSFLMQVNQARQWWLGDWWNACRWGDGKSACAEIGVDYQTARKCGQVAKSFEFVRRRTLLTFGHHEAVCPIEDKEMQDKLLNWCLVGTQRKSVRDLREKVQEFLEQNDWEDFDTAIQNDNPELTEAHKRIKELESGKTPNKDKLIPGLMKKYKGASITPGMADRLSVLPEETQEIFLSLFDTTTSARKEQQAAMDDKLRALEDLNKISKERDAVKKQLEQIATTDTAAILLEKEAALKLAREEYERKLMEARKSIGKEASELHEQRFKDKIFQAEEARDKAERKAKEEHERAKAAWEHQRELEAKIKNLESQLEVDNPTNVDNARERHIVDAGKGFIIAINELRKDLDHLGGGMEKSLEAVADVINKASLELAKLQGMQDAIITV